MYVSDRKTSNILASIVLIFGPWVGVSRQAWGWILDLILLLSIFIIGQNDKDKGFRQGIILLVLGFCLTIVNHGFYGIESMSFIPLVAFVTLWCLKKNLPQSVAVFISLSIVGLLSLIPSFTLIVQGVPQESTQIFINQIMEQYRQAGMLEAFQQQGIGEREIISLLEQVINMLILVTPAFTVLKAFILWGIAYYIILRWFHRGEQKLLPFTQWRLPWYAIWGMNLAIICYLIGDISQWLALKSFGINLMLVYAAVALVLGSAVFVSLLKSSKLSRFWRGLLVFVSFIYFNITIIVLILVGLADLVLNFRKRSKGSSNS